MTEPKSAGAFRTIGELSAELGLPQHILRYWETRFPQLRPLTRAGNRRYYRPAEVALAQRIHHLLSHQGYTVRGVQKLLADRSAAASTLDLTDVTPPPPPAPSAPVTAAPSLDVERLTALRDRLAEALTA